MLNVAWQNIRNLCGEDHLDPTDPKANVNKLATLQSTPRHHSALLPDSEYLAAKGTPDSAESRANAIWSGICWGAKTISGAHLLSTIYNAYKNETFTQNTIWYCSKEFGSSAANGLWNATGNLFQTGKSMVYEALDPNSLVAQANTQLSAIQFYLDGVCDVFKASAAKACYEFPIVYQIGASIRDGWYALDKTYLMAGATAIGAMGYFVNKQFETQKEEQARIKLLDGLLDTYQSAAQHLVAKFQKAQLEQDHETWNHCHELAEQIQNNLPFIRKQIAKCGTALTRDQQRDIVGKIEAAINQIQAGNQV